MSMSVPTETMEEEETRSVTAREIKTNMHADFSGHHLNYLSTTNNFFELGSTSLLVESGTRPKGLFAPGDRFIPCRLEENQFGGVQQFYHEENLLLSRQARKN